MPTPQAVAEAGLGIYPSVLKMMIRALKTGSVKSLAAGSTPVHA